MQQRLNERKKNEWTGPVTIARNLRCIETDFSLRFHKILQARLIQTCALTLLRVNT